MNASKVILSAKTKEALQFKGLDAAKRRTLKENRVYDFIREQENGIATISQLIAVAGYNPNTEYHTGFAFIKRMQRNNLITTFDKHVFRKRWIITEEVARQKARASKSATQNDPQPKAEHTSEWLTDRAKDFAWIHNSDSLREFIEWLNHVPQNQ